jgi:hypothetical protein
MGENGPHSYLKQSNSAATTIVGGMKKRRVVGPTLGLNRWPRRYSDDGIPVGVTLANASGTSSSPPAVSH